jgi:hypothetical protein
VTLYYITYRPPRNNLGGVIQAVTSATQVQLQNTAQTTVTGANVTFGTDDTAAVQNALNAHSHVYLPPGRYTIRSTTPLTVNRSGVCLRGAGPHLSVLTGSVGLPSFLNFAAPGQTVIEDLEVVGVDFDGMPDRLKIQGIGFASARRVSVRQVAGAGMEGFLGFDHASDWVLTEFSTVDTMDTISISRSREGTVSDGRILRCNEALDFFASDDVAVSSVVITSHAAGQHPGIYQTAIDFSSSKRVTFSGVVVRGDFRQCVLLKQEEPPEPSVQDVIFSGCEFLDFSQSGAYSSAGLTTTEANSANRGVRFEGCTFRTSSAASGVYLSASASNEVLDFAIVGCNIDVPGHAIRNTDYDNLEVRDCVLRGTGTSPTVFVAGVSGLVLAGCRVESAGAYAVEVSGVTDPVIQDCIVRSVGNTAIVVQDCRRPVVRGNVVPSANYHGIYVAWYGTAGLDTQHFTVGAVIDQNVVRNWGTGATDIGAIEVRFAGPIGSGSYNALSVSGNRLLLNGVNPGQQRQAGILFMKGPLASIDWAKVDDNLIYGTWLGIVNETDLGTNSTRNNNSFKAGLP